ncbi:MAG TPA: DUF2157 domain-containing protein [Pontiella sp.]|nr:DUF2157 domain-containing protein [Pontiella sp.]
MRKVSDRHRQWLMKELPYLEKAGILSSESAGQIRSYYETSTQSGVHWAIIAFAVLGSLLIGSGIILLFAHNWEDLTRPTRAVLSFCPLMIGSVLCLLALRRNSGVALRESSGIFQCLAVGASIALIGQTYHIPGNAPAFLLTWSLLILPLMFLLRATGAYLIYLALICGWIGAAQEDYGQAAAFWLLALPAVVRLIQLFRKDRHSPEALTGFAGLLVTCCISVGMVFERNVPGLWIVAYSALLSASGLLGLYLYGDREGWNNIPKTFGVIGMAILAYIFTFQDLWQEIGWGYVRTGWSYRTWGAWLDGGITACLLAGWILLAIKAFRRDSIESVTLSVFPAIAILCFVFGSLAEETDMVNALAFNAFMLFLGIMYIVMGCRNIRLRQLNGGMAILSLLLVTRFFDAEFGYLARGVVFIVLGSSFLGVNFIMIRRKKQKEVRT